MAPEPDGVGRRLVELYGEETVEGAEGGQPAVDGGGGVAAIPTMGDVGVYVVESDGVRGLSAQVKKSLT